jgi:uncharacterized membrane protein YkoI
VWDSLALSKEPIMVNTKLLLSVLLSALLLTTAPLFAAQLNLSSVIVEHEGADSAIKAKLKVLEHVKISIDDAISAVEGMKGGAVIGVRLDVRNGKPIYRVKTYQNNSVWQGMVDAQTGNMIGMGKTTPENQLDQKKRGELTELGQAYTSLGEAVVMAEDRDAGRAINASLGAVKGTIVFEVTVVKNDSVRKMAVDPTSGQPVGFSAYRMIGLGKTRSYRAAAAAPGSMSRSRLASFIGLDMALRGRSRMSAFTGSLGG